MTPSIALVSQSDLLQRRKLLRQQRRLRLVKGLWRLLMLTGLGVALVGTVRSPIWVIRRPDQVEVKGSRYIQAEAVRSLLPIAYPQSLWQVEPQAIANQVKAKLPVQAITVSRQLFPPGLTVQLAEPDFVALAVPIGNNTIENSGLLDEAGNWVALAKYTVIDPNFKQPKLKIIGNPEQYRPYWPKLYQACRTSPIKIIEIHWSDPNNLLLQTELGSVRIGAYSPTQFQQQLVLLSKMKLLPEQLKQEQIGVIDISDPENPTIQAAKPKNLVKSEPESSKKEGRYD